MKKAYLMVILLLWASANFAQDQTRAAVGSSYFVQETYLTVVPFEPKMLISDLHPPMCKQNNLEDKAMIAALQELLLESFQSVEGVVLNNDFDQYPYALLPHLGYRYLPVPSDDTKEKSAEKRSPFIRNSGVQGGEIKSSRSKTPHYMKPVLEAEVVQSLFEGSNAQVMCIISELDFKIDHYTSVAPGEARYKTIALHYALYKRNGEEIYSGLVSRSTNTSNYQLAHLKNEYLIPLCAEILEQLKIAQAKEMNEAAKDTPASKPEKEAEGEKKKAPRTRENAVDEDF
ncbi:MAG: hypothetical protein NWS86_11195 [Flavobacteriales bacterium]|nr:hypothetical protein [Flavobacteriales bacterium]